MIYCKRNTCKHVYDVCRLFMTVNPFHAGYLQSTCPTFNSELSIVILGDIRLEMMVVSQAANAQEF